MSHLPELIPTPEANAALLEVGKILNALSPDDRWFALSQLAAIRLARVREARQDALRDSAS